MWQTPEGMDLRVAPNSNLLDMNKLPFLISIPHGGTAIPKELRSRIHLTLEELLADGDPYTGDIYDMGGDVESLLKFDIARALIDVNRAKNDLPPTNPDGAIKTVSIFNSPVFHNGQEPGIDDVALLLTTYYEPYHGAIQKALENTKILFAFDCHSMEAIGPPVAKDAGSRRPLFCLGNNNGKSCSEEAVQLFASCISESYSVPAGDITINEPFSGGYITKEYGMNPVPWIQVEMNRCLYLDEQARQIDHQKLQGRSIPQLNDCFRQALIKFCNTIRH